MSGAKQHFIPQFLLREFSLEESRLAKIKRVWVYTKNKAAFATATEGIAAQRYFYSQISPSGETTLDDIITDYEHEIRDIHAHLLTAPDNVDAEACSAFAGHLVIRNAHLRSAFKYGFESVMEAALSLIGSEAKLRQAFGLDRQVPTVRFKEAFLDFLRENPKIASSLNLEHDQIERLAFIAAKENFSSFSGPFIDALHIGFSKFLGDFSSDVRDQHNRLLTATLLPTGIYKEMLSFHWKVVRTTKSLILPDCVAIGYEYDGSYQPLMLCRSEKLTSIICPTSSQIALIGSRDNSEVALTSFNDEAAECSHEFFVASEAGEDFAQLATYIARKAHSAIDSAIDLAAARFDNLEGMTEEGLEYVPGLPLSESRVFGGKISIQLRDFGDRELAERLGQQIWAIVEELSSDLPLGLVEEFTFAVDYDGALADLDRGLEGLAPLKSFNESYGIGAIMAPTVVRDDHVKVHIVARAEIALGLLSDNEEQRRLSISSIVYALGRAAHVAILDDSVPRIWFGRITEEFDGRRLGAIEAAYSSYFSSRLVARIGAISFVDYLEMLQNCLEVSKTIMTNALRLHQKEPDFRRLSDQSSDVAENVILISARVLGYFHGCDLRPDESPELQAALGQYGLEKWIVRFGSDLADLWNTQGQQVGLRKYAAMLDHFDRVMLACGVFVWPTADGLMIYPQSVEAAEA